MARNLGMGTRYQVSLVSFVALVALVRLPTQLQSR